MQKTKYKRTINRLKKRINTLLHTKDHVISNKNINDIETTFTEIKPKVLEAITEAKQASLPIVIVECCPEKYGHTLDCIVEEVDFYEQVYFVEKFDNDGAQAIEMVLHENDIEVEEHRICGVNIGACVHDTIMSLMDDYFRNIVILKSACNCIHIESKMLIAYTLLNILSV